ncbi:sensor histidine kinase [Kineosporia babensis]
MLWLVLGYLGASVMIVAAVVFAAAPVMLVHHPVLCWWVTMLFAPFLAFLARDEGVLVLCCLAIYTAAGILSWSRPWRVSVPATAGSGVLLLMLFATLMPGVRVDQNAPVLVMALLCVWVVANSGGQARRRALAARTRATEQAIEAERLRIAREMHDLIAHSLGAIAFQAGMGARVIDSQPAQARHALSAIESTSRQTLAELRRTLGALRRSDPEGAPAAPMPNLADLDRLISTTREAGVTLELERLGEVRELPADLELSAFRIVQESVTNVVRHAGTPSCRVRLVFHPAELEIEVLDQGRGSGAALSSGYGLVGMRERITLLDGQFSAGPREQGGFRVGARFPIPATDA